MGLATEFITLNDGTKICAPADISLMTCFVLKEQGDWFEDEIHFVRQFMNEGMNALDIGANYGLYATAIAKHIGPKGKLWCFEPTPNTANALTQTIQENGFDDRVEIVQSGLSKEKGEATFYMSPNAELNSLTPQPGLEETTIQLATLDECAQTYAWPKIDFIKLDAEGEEINILQGGKTFFAQNAPLVMFELKHKETLNMPLIDAFKQLGYDSYYLVPGLGVLAPFEASSTIDDFALNLFAVKADKVAGLIEAGVAVSKTDIAAVKEMSSVGETFTSMTCFDGLGIEPSAVAELDEDYRKVLLAVVASRNTALSVQERYDQLSYAIELTKIALQDGRKTKPERLSTLARAAYDGGYRRVGNQILLFLFEQFIKPSKPFNLSESFVPVAEVFESVASQSKPDMWFCAMVLDQLLHKQSFSSVFGGAPETLKFIDVIEQLGFMRPELERRRATIKECIAANG